VSSLQSATVLEAVTKVALMNRLRAYEVCTQEGVIDVHHNECGSTRAIALEARW